MTYFTSWDANRDLVLGYLGIRGFREGGSDDGEEDTSEFSSG